MYAHAVKQVWGRTHGSWHYDGMEQCIPHGLVSLRSSTEWSILQQASCNQQARLLLDPQRAESRHTDTRDRTETQHQQTQIEAWNHTEANWRF
jgi:hypothetical protein